MIQRLFFAAVVVTVAAIVVNSLPDAARYLKMREM